MKSLNITIVSGSVSEAPNLQYSKSGKPFTTLSILPDQSPNNKYPSAPIPITILGDMALPAAESLAQGDLAILDCSLKAEVYKSNTNLKLISWSFLKLEQTKAPEPGTTKDDPPF